MIVTVKRVFSIVEAGAELPAFIRELEETCNTWQGWRILDDPFEEGSVVVEAKVVLNGDAWDLFWDIPELDEEEGGYE